MDHPTVLIVDDEVIIARDLEARLTTLGYEVAGIASSGAEAIRLAEATRPGLVLMDIVLKGNVDGIGAAAEIRRRFHIPVIYVTAYADKQTLDRAKVTEPFAYVVKPFSERELHANIEMALFKSRSEQRLRRLERWFGIAMNEVADAVIATDHQGRITSFNSAAEAITEWSRADALGKRLSDVFRLVERASGRPVALEEITNGPVVRLAGETGLLSRSGRVVPVDSTTSCIRDESDQPTGTVSVFRDASGQRNASLVALNGEIAVAAAGTGGLMEMLQACTESLVRHLQAAFARIWTVDSSGKILVLQASAGQYTHLDGPHGRVPIGQFKIGRIAQERRPLATNDVANDPNIADPDWARREGMVAFAGYPLTIGDRLLGVLAVFSRQRLHDSVFEALGPTASAIAVAIERRLSEQRLESVVASSPAILYRLSGDHPDSLRLTWISDNVEEILGFGLEEVMHPTWWFDHLHPEDMPAVMAQIQAELLTRERLAQEYRFRRGDGAYCWMRSEMRLFRAVEGEPVEVVGSWADITERKKLEDQFRQAQKMEAVGQLAGGVAHDFNNLLTVISGYSQILLASRELDERKKGLAREIGKASERAASLTRQLLAFSRKQVLEPKVLDLNAVVIEQKKMLSRLIGEDIEFATVLDPQLYRVKADPGQLEQVIMNLAVNARDAMPHGGKLTLETHNVTLDTTYASTRPDVEAGPYAMIVMADTGCGMTPQVLSRVFEPFFTTKGVGKGTGLGLATVYGIIRQSGGHVGVYSEPGIGTTFKLYLPPVAGEVPDDLSLPDQPLPTGNETILLVEDEDAVRAIARHILESCGYQVLEANHGAAAITVSEQFAGPIHLVLTDVVMPEMAGRPLIERLARQRPDAKVLFMSGYTDDAVIRQGVLEAETAFLHKPFLPFALAAKVREVLDHGNSRLGGVAQKFS